MIFRSLSYTFVNRHRFICSILFFLCCYNIISNDDDRDDGWLLRDSSTCLCNVYYCCSYTTATVVAVAAYVSVNSRPILQRSYQGGMQQNHPSILLYYPIETVGIIESTTRRQRHRHRHRRNVWMLSKQDNNEQQQHEQMLIIQMKQQFQESFDRWRFLQNLLDDDENKIDTVFILLLLQIMVRQKIQQLDTTMEQRLLSSSFSIPNELIESTPNDDNENDGSFITTTTTTATTITKGMNDDDNWNNNVNLRQSMEYIINDVSIETLQQSLQPSASEQRSLPTAKTTLNDNNSNVVYNDIYLFQQHMEFLLPNPLIDEDANKGLWDTIIELHGRESVKYNTNNNSNSGWKTRCLISRLLIYYDFLSNGIQ